MICVNFYIILPFPCAAKKDDQYELEGEPVHGNEGSGKGGGSQKDGEGQENTAEVYLRFIFNLFWLLLSLKKIFFSVTNYMLSERFCSGR